MEEINASTLEIEKTIEPQYIISLEKFIFLSLITFGLYPIWWNYKAWRFFQEKENNDLQPVIRTIFGIFFILSLFNRILHLAKTKDYQRSYSAVLLLLGQIIMFLLSYLPDPFGIISIFTFLFFLPPFEALNYAKRKSSDFEVIEQNTFNGRQIFLIVVGSIWWILIIYSIYTIMNPEYIGY